MELLIKEAIQKQDSQDNDRRKKKDKAKENIAFVSGAPGDKINLMRVAAKIFF